MSRPTRAETSRPVTVVHLQPGPDGYDNEGVRRSWQADGYATLPVMEGHPAGERCGICSRGDREKRGPGG
jgi:hypothetical protein